MGLEKPITEEEINTAQKESALEKSPGPDGFTIYYYKKFEENVYLDYVHT